MNLDQDTIVAISTPPGRGGIGVVRLSGPSAQACAAPMLRLRKPLAPSQANFGHIVDEHGEALDESVITLFKAPHSYTSEDVVEISAHGAPVLLDYLLRTAIAHGARLAQPGEFTQRAFLSGRLDLTQAEAVNDLIAAQTLYQAKLAAAQLGGSIARIITPIKQDLIALIAALEAGVDFAEDDLDLLPQPEITSRLETLIARLIAIAGTYRYGRLVHEGVRLAIIGQPNVGKSSLFNRLLERERAIVTAQPGTTRDLVTERLAIGGIPVELIDTAGLRELALTPDTEAERLGIARSQETIAEADLLLHVVDSQSLVAGELSPADRATQHHLAGRSCILVLNKSDLPPAAHGDLLNGLQVVRTSARTGDGIEALKQAILGLLGAQTGNESALISNLRQAEAIHAALQSLKKALAETQRSIPHEFLLLDLHEALAALDTLTGTSTPDDILNLIFSTFCIGK